MYGETSDRKDDRWFAPKLGEDVLEWKFFRVAPSKLQARLKLPLVQRRLVPWQCGQFIKQQQPELLITHDYSLSHYCAQACARAQASIDHVAFSFNLPQLPTGQALESMREAFQGISTFMVYSTSEKHTYHDWFQIPLDRIDVLHWAVEAPDVSQFQAPIVSGNYICAIGHMNRDYRFLFDVMRTLPHVRLVAVVRGYNVIGLDVPDNVQILTDIPFGAAMNVLHFSKFMVLPLTGDHVPSGHRTLVSAMQLQKAILCTYSSGVTDYLLDRQNGYLVPPGSIDAMRDQIQSLWQDSEQAVALGRNGKAFADKFCSEARTLEYLQQLLQKRGLLTAVA
jgi:glycosyltransferase involved in cell wall biosynthesis